MYKNYCNCCGCYDQCKCCDCYPEHPVYPIKPIQPIIPPIKPERPRRENYAQFVSDGRQVIETRRNEFVEFPCTIVTEGCDIKLKNKDTIVLEPGKYSVDYYVTIINRGENHDTFKARLFVYDCALDYTTSRIRLDNPHSEFIGPLTKTNLINVKHQSTLKLGISVSDPREHDKHCVINNACYVVRDASIVIKKLD